MKIRAVELDDEEDPAAFTVTLSLDEMALLYRLTGHVAPLTITEVFGDVRWGNAVDDLATGAGNALNTYYEDGANDVIPKPKREMFPRVARRTTMARDGQCIGDDGGDYGAPGCAYEPEFVVGGDLACRYHLVRVTRMRLREIGHDILIGFERASEEGQDGE